MEKEIEDITRRLEVHLKSAHTCDETLFNLGIELGKQLEKEGINEHRLQIFIDYENSNNLFNEKSNIIERIEKVCLFLIKQAIKEKMKDGGSYCFDPNYSIETGMFDDDIVDKWFVQLEDVCQQDGGDFDAMFKLNGELAEIFNKYNVPPSVKVNISNTTGEDSETIYDADDLNGLYSASAMIRRHDENWQVSELTKLADEIDKCTLFKRVSS